MLSPSAVLLSGVLLSLHAEPPVYYTRDIRPILAENCFYCHGQDATQRKADLRLDTRAGQRAEGIVTPGNLAESALAERIRAADATKLMPPAKSNRKLTESQKKLLERWITEGALFEEHLCPPQTATCSRHRRHEPPC